MTLTSARDRLTSSRGRVRSRRVAALSVSSIVVLVGSVLTVTATPAVSVVNSCRARNATKGTIARSDLQAVIRNASAGDVIEVRNVCVGHFSIGKRLTLIGRATPTVLKAALHAGGSGRTVRVTAQVTLRNLRILGGNVPGGRGGGISNDGTLTLRDSIVRGNHALVAGGIYNGGVLRLNGSSSVVDNTADHSGGIFNDGGQSTVTLNGSSSVRGNTSANHGGGIGSYYGWIIMHDAAAVADNEALGVGGGIFAQFAVVTLSGSSSVSGNRASFAAGIYDDFSGVVMLGGTSTVSDNVANGSGGGIVVGSGAGSGNTTDLIMSSSATVIGNEAAGSGGGIYVVGTGGRAMLNDSSSITGNAANSDDMGGGVGGGIFSECDGVVTGAVDGANVDGNVTGTASPVEDNIALEIC